MHIMQTPLINNDFVVLVWLFDKDKIYLLYFEKGIETLRSYMYKKISLGTVF